MKTHKKNNKYIHKPQLEVQRKETDWWDDGHTSLTGGPVTRKHFPAPAAIFFLLSGSCLLLPPKALLSLFFEHTSTGSAYLNRIFFWFEQKLKTFICIL